MLQPQVSIPERSKSARAYVKYLLDKGELNLDKIKQLAEELCVAEDYIKHLKFELENPVNSKPRRKQRKALPAGKIAGEGIAAAESSSVQKKTLSEYELKRRAQEKIDRKRTREIISQNRIKKRKELAIKLALERIKRKEEAKLRLAKVVAERDEERKKKLAKKIAERKLAKIKLLAERQEEREWKERERKKEVLRKREEQKKATRLKHEKARLERQIVRKKKIAEQMKETQRRKDEKREIEKRAVEQRKKERAERYEQARLKEEMEVQQKIRERQERREKKEKEKLARKMKLQKELELKKKKKEEGRFTKAIAWGIRRRKMMLERLRKEKEASMRRKMQAEEIRKKKAMEKEQIRLNFIAEREKRKLEKEEMLEKRRVAWKIKRAQRLEQKKIKQEMEKEEQKERAEKRRQELELKRQEKIKRKEQEKIEWEKTKEERKEKARLKREEKKKQKALEWEKGKEKRLEIKLERLKQRREQREAIQREKKAKKEEEKAKRLADLQANAPQLWTPTQARRWFWKNFGRTPRMRQLKAFAEKHNIKFAKDDKARQSELLNWEDIYLDDEFRAWQKTPQAIALREREEELARLEAEDRIKNPHLYVQKKRKRGRPKLGETQEIAPPGIPLPDAVPAPEHAPKTEEVDDLDSLFADDSMDLTHLTPEQMQAIQRSNEETLRKIGRPVHFPEIEAEKKVPVRALTPKIGRNDPCPFDSSKKFKRCCGLKGGSYCIKQQQSAEPEKSGE
jgi:hypothetical protein